MLLLKNLLFTIVVPGTVLVLLPALVLGPEASLASGGWRAAGSVFVALGIAIYFACLWDFATRGRGTPAPVDPPKELVARGIYRWVRNPMYLGIWAALIGEALLFYSAGLVVYLGTVALVQVLFVRLYEEPTLAKKFGAEYVTYRRTVPGWIPRIPGRPHTIPPD